MPQPEPIILAERRPRTGPADMAAVKAACAQGFYQRAYGAALGCPEAAAYIEQHKADALAALVAAWRAEKGGSNAG